MSSRNNIELHSFYCMNCGKKILELPRSKSHQYSKHHRKALYCPWCKITSNAIECRSDVEIYEFKEAFEAGEYKEEMLKSAKYIEENNIWRNV